MLSNEIVMFATLVNLGILGISFWRTRSLSFSEAGYGSENAGKSREKTCETISAGQDSGKNTFSDTAKPETEPAPVPVQTNQRRFLRPKAKRIVMPDEAAEILIEHMQAEGHIGPHTASEIDMHWANCVVLYDLEELSAQFVRGAIRQFHMGQRRLNGPEFIHVRQRTGQDRAHLYRIPACRPVATYLPAEMAIGSAASAESSVAPAGHSVVPPQDPPDAPEGGPATAWPARPATGSDKINDFKPRVAA